MALATEAANSSSGAIGAVSRNRAGTDTRTPAAAPDTRMGRGSSPGVISRRPAG